MRRRRLHQQDHCPAGQGLSPGLPPAVSETIRALLILLRSEREFDTRPPGSRQGRADFFARLAGFTPAAAGGQLEIPGIERRAPKSILL